VLIPPGEFLVGTVELKSNVTLRLEAAGHLVGSGKPADYSAGKGVPPGNGNVVMLYAANADNITIEGPGTVDGQGHLFYTGKGDNTGPGGNRAEGYVNRPHLLVFYRCSNLRIREVFLTRSAYHCARILECRYVYLDGVRIYNRVNLNNDGFHLNSNQYVNISNCNVMCQDDACALFGGNRFVTVTNCTFSTRWSIFRFGGGQAENIAVSNCVIYDTYGCVIKIRVGAGRASRTSRSTTWSCATSPDRSRSGSIPPAGALPMRRRSPRASSAISPSATFRRPWSARAASSLTCRSRTISDPAKRAPASP
jgi:polygalacturonase